MGRETAGWVGAFVVGEAHSVEDRRVEVGSFVPQKKDREGCIGGSHTLVFHALLHHLDARCLSGTPGLRVLDVSRPESSTRCQSRRWIRVEKEAAPGGGSHPERLQVSSDGCSDDSGFVVGKWWRSLHSGQGHCACVADCVGALSGWSRGFESGAVEVGGGLLDAFVNEASRVSKRSGSG